MQYQKSVLIFILFFISISLLSCSNSNSPLIEGRFVDAPVQGLSYESLSYSGETGEEGSFYYRKGELVTFKIGKIVLGTSFAKMVVSPIDLVPNGTTSSDAVINISRLLQSLDSIPGDGKIKIPQGVLMNAIKGEMDSLAAGLDFSDPAAFDVLIDNVIQFVTNNVADYATPPSVVDAATAKAHLEASLSDIVADISGAYPYPVPIAESGQTISYSQKDDGELRTGVAWPSPRFTNNNDGTVLDNLTGLIWLQDAFCFGTRSYDDAMLDANTLNSGECGLTDGSVEGDWRIPQIREFFSLIDFGVPDPGPRLTVGHPFNNVTNYPFYWSSTGGAYDPAWALQIDVGISQVNWSDKSTLRNVWPVKGGVQ